MCVQPGGGGGGDSVGVGILLELCRPGSLHDFLDSDAPLPLAGAVEMVRQAVAGLRHLHRFGVIHRDFSADNILIAALDPLKLKVRQTPAVATAVCALDEWAFGAMFCRFADWQGDCIFVGWCVLLPVFAN